MSKGMNGNKNKLSFMTERSPNYHIIYANGAFGGVTPKGEIKFDLFIDHAKIPDKITHAVLQNGRSGGEIEKIPTQRPVTIY